MWIAVAGTLEVNQIRPSNPMGFPDASPQIPPAPVRNANADVLDRRARGQVQRSLAQGGAILRALAPIPPVH